jgi:hypothetical protein
MWERKMLTNPNVQNILFLTYRLRTSRIKQERKVDTVAGSVAKRFAADGQSTNVATMQPSPFEAGPRR